MRNPRHPLAPFLLATLAAAAGHAQQSRAELRFDIKAVDRTADPCQDFYRFACGGWLARNPIPADRSYAAVFLQMRDLNQRRVTEILEHAAQPRDRAAGERQIGDYYASCMDEAAIEAADMAPLRPELARIDAITTRDGLAAGVAHLQKLGADLLFSLGADQALEDATRVIAYLDQGGLNLPDPGDYTSQDAERVQTRIQYQAHLEEVFRLLGEDAPRAAASAQAVLRIETALARASLTPLQRRDRKAWYHPMTLAALQRLAPEFPWHRYFAVIGFVPDGPLNVAVPALAQAIDDLLAKTPMPEWRSYLRWALVRAATPALPERFRASDFGFYSRTLEGVSQQPSRSRRCAELTSRDLGEAVGRAFVARYFPPSTRERALDLVARLRRAMEADFREIPWMGPATRLEALRKLELIRVMIGHPDRWRDDSGLRVERGDALGNAYRARAFELGRQLALIGRPLDRGAFYELPQSVSGYHDNPLNVVVFTAGILQPPFFDPRMDDAVTLGLTGGVIGHELTHAFDDKGHLFDGAGNLRDWWSSEDAKSYDQRAACFVRQYSGYTAVDEVKVNGELTLGENIADNGGLQLAFRAFDGARQQPQPAIDGFSPEQRFFLGWAQWRCMNVSSRTAAIWARTDAHAPGRWRVNGVVSNMPSFAKAYACKAGDPMVNAEPCRIW